MKMPSKRSAQRKPKICFVSPYNYPLFNPDYTHIHGGWEVRISEVAKELARRGNFRVSVIVADMGQPHVETRESVELMSWSGKPFWGIPAPPNNSEEAFGEQLSGELNAASATSQPAPTEITSPVKPPIKSRFAKIKILYKKIVPWKIRIVVHGALGGIRVGCKIAWEGLRAGYKTARDQARPAFSLARLAVGNIGDMPVFPDMVEIFSEADAEIYIAPGVSDISASVAWYCKKHKRRYIMLAGSDLDFNPEILTNPDGYDNYQTSHALLLYSIKNASGHIAQNERQVELAKAFGVSPLLIRNPVDLERKYPKGQNPKTILWVGNTNERVKQPSLMLEMVKAFPDYPFVMIVFPVHPDVMELLFEASRTNSNLEVLSNVPYQTVEQYYAQAKILVNTSPFEGFPNTFLQAGKYGVPIVSLSVDPNGMISQHGCGLLSGGDKGILKRDIERLMTDPALYERLSANVLEYVRENHDKDKIISQYEAFLNSVLN